MTETAGVRGEAPPLLARAAEIAAAVADAAGLNPLYLSAREKEELLLELSSSVDRLEALRMQVLAVADDVAAEHGARSAGRWVAHLRRDRAAKHANAEQLGAALDRRHPRVGEAARAGRVTLEQARVIVRALDKVGDAASPELQERATEHLLGLADEWEPLALARLADRVWEALAPDEHEDRERKLVEAELARAEAQTRLSIRTCSDGTADIRARVPAATASRLRTYLEAFSTPRRDHLADGRPAPGLPGAGSVLHAQRLGEAFCSLLEVLDPATLPVHGGAATTVTVTIPFHDLRASTGVGALDDGTPVPVGEVRRLACTAGIVPAVLGGRSEVLDLGRSRRLFSPAQRKALAIAHPACQAAGCDIPGRWCEAHHAAEPWSAGGRTDLADAELLCRRHHRLAHDDRYDARRRTDGSVRFHRRT
ncbi:MAG: DUF222 domain-containing protein [Nocardioides sp.]|nr:DUF222 domain-containing protein [Nocardioides sp.]